MWILSFKTKRLVISREQYYRERSEEGNGKWMLNSSIFLILILKVVMTYAMEVRTETNIRRRHLKKKEWES